jgi:hypothetical protein
MLILASTIYLDTRSLGPSEASKKVSDLHNTPSTAPMNSTQTPSIIIQDNFDDNLTDASLWEKVQADGFADEVNGQLQLTVPSDSNGSYRQAGYVTKNPLDIQAANWFNQGFEVSVNVSKLNDPSQMILMISDQKITSIDPYNATNFYRIFKVGGTYYRYDSQIFVESRINGNYSLKVDKNGLSSTGQLKIRVSSGSIAFYENGVMQYAEPYALPSSQCYIYVYTSTPSRVSVTDSFDNFAVSSPKVFRDDFSDGNYDCWTVDDGTWTANNTLLNSTANSSRIHINSPFSINEHVRADIQTVTSNNQNISDAAWLVLKEQDEDNMVYAFIGTNGTVELSVVFNGETTTWQALSSLSPYDMHSMAVSLIGDNAKVWVDGMLYIDQSSPYLTYLAGYTGLYSPQSTATYGYVAVFS